MRVDYVSNYRAAERGARREPVSGGLLRLLAALDLAGHATVSTATLLAATGLCDSDFQLMVVVLEVADVVAAVRAVPGGPATAVRCVVLSPALSA